MPPPLSPRAKLPTRASQAVLAPADMRNPTDRRLRCLTAPSLAAREPRHLSHDHRPPTELMPMRTTMMTPARMVRSLHSAASLDLHVRGRAGVFLALLLLRLARKQGILLSPSCFKTFQFMIDMTLHSPARTKWSQALLSSHYLLLCNTLLFGLHAGTSSQHRDRTRPRRLGRWARPPSRH